MTTRAEIQMLVSYVLGEKSKESLLSTGFDSLPQEKKVSALRGLQDLGWISHGGMADYAESYSLTKEGRRIVSERPEVSALDKKTQEHLIALGTVDSSSNGERKEGLGRLIDIECELGNWDSALLNCYELRRLAERTKDAQMVAQSLYNQGKVEVAQNRWDEALESYLNALEKFMESGDRKGVCETNRAMGVVYGNKGDHASAKRCLESSVDCAKALGERALQAKAEANLAIIYDLEGRFEQSEQASKNCLEYFLQAGDSAAAGRISNNLGVLNMSREKYGTAAQYFEKAIDLCRALKMKDVFGAALVNAGYCFAKTGNAGPAISYTDEAISIFKEPNNLNMLALTYRNYGVIEMRGANLEEGFKWFEKSVRAAKSSGVEDTLAACCYEYGMALIASLTNLRLARKLLSRSSEAYREIGNLEQANMVRAKLAAI